jgi:NAD-dependent deacetylase
MNTTTSKKHIVIFSGAGMSAESGIQTFRDSNGLWENNRIEDVATPEAWNKNPDLVTNFYNQRRKNIINSNPNNAHILIADMETFATVTVITQNIDDLHERAGSTKVLHLHGNIRLAKSSHPNLQEKEFFSISGWELTENDCCPMGYRLRPHVVWFGEEVPAYDEAIQIISNADYLIVVGTSLQVYPAAGIIHFATNASSKYLVDPNAKSYTIPSDFQCIALNASKGILHVYSEIKKALTQGNA